MYMAGLLFLAQAELPMPAIPQEGGFFSIGKIILMAVFAFLWAWPAGWVCRDSRRVGLNEFTWGLVILGSGLLGWFCWVMFPSYLVGFLFFILLSLGGVLAYALYRDSLVEEKQKILKPENFLEAIKGEEKEARFEVNEKVKLFTYEGKEAVIPSDSEQQKLYQMFQDMFFDALWRRTSDVYVQPMGEEYRVLFRIDGVGSEYARLDKKTARGIINYVKRASGLDVGEYRKPQKVRMSAQQVEVQRKVDLDIETSGSRLGERLLIKVRAEESRFAAGDVGFSIEQLKQIEEILKMPQGLVLISGLQDAGVSTTLYAIARSHDAFTQNLQSVEIKPLMEMDNITQHVYKPGEHESIPRLLQSVSRRDPDVMLVDPCGDPDTMKMIGKLVETKKMKIFTTLRGSSALSALGRAARWMDDMNLASETIVAVTYQRLVRMLCPTCREAYKPNLDTLRKLNLSGKAGVTFYRPPTTQVVDKKGNPILCGTCQGTGYMGRTAIFEMVVIDDSVRQAIRSGDANAIKSAVRKSGTTYWQEAAMDKVIAGLTSVQEIIRVSKEAQEQEKSK